MKKIYTVVYSAFAIIMLVNYFYYRSLYNKQINYIFELLDRQVQIVGLEVDKINNSFLSDLNQINFSEDLTAFFDNPENYRRAIDRMKLFYSKYEDFVTGIKFYDKNKNEFTLKKDTESNSGEWLEQSFVLHIQANIHSMEDLIQENKRYNYYLPVYNEKNETIGNIVVTIDFQKYFREVFTTFNLQDYQWQWVVSDSGEIIYNNFDKPIQYQGLDKIVSRLAEGSVENTIHKAFIEGETVEIISSYYSTQLLQRGLGLVFSAPTTFFQKYIIRNSLLIVLLTLLLVQVIISIFWKHIKGIKDEKAKMKASEEMFMKIFNEMPVGVVIYGKEKQIISANQTASTFCLPEQSLIPGMQLPQFFYPETDSTDTDSRVFSDQFLLLKKPEGEIVLFRKSIPIVIHESEATMDILMDVTILESARKLEAKKNAAKSEFLARMSYELRTPLNGIVSMTDVLSQNDLSEEIKEIVNLMQRSSEALSGIVENILDFSKIESGSLVIDEVVFNLKEEIEYCIDVARTNCDNENVSITCSIDDKIPASIVGDPARIRQVITSFMNHSLRFTESGRIDLKCFLKTCHDNVLTIFFEIADTGLSFDNVALNKKFSQNPDSTAFINDDPAFGIVLSRKLISFMGGSFSAESPSGLDGTKGLKISFSLVVHSAEKTIKKVDTDNITSFDGISTLVITGPNRDEDVIAGLHQLKLSLSVTTYMKLTINQLKANIKIPGEGRYHLIIITDTPGLDGFEVAKSIWDNKLTEGFKIMMITTNDHKGNYLKCIELGIDCYLVKPFTIEELEDKIRECFPSTDKNAPLEKSKDAASLKILFVEDNKLNQIAIGTMLKNMGYSFDIAEDGYSAFLQAKAKKYDLILMDLFLPEIDGFEATQKILGAGRSPVIVAITADNLPDTRKKAELAGISDFITKPIRQDDLKKMFSRHFK
ncbi:MAG TPA: response regulator [Bacteroidales bacterium]|nr:response regulator [Bacteroidales bacterium]